MRRKYLYHLLVVLMILLCPSLVSAGPLAVQADSTYYDTDTGLYMLDGNVTVRVKDAEIQAPMARVSLATMEVFAEGGIRITQGDAVFCGDSVFLNARERQAFIEGNIVIEDNGLLINCSKADFNWKTKDVLLTDARITANGGETYVNEAVYNVRSKNLTY